METRDVSGAVILCLAHGCLRPAEQEGYCHEHLLLPQVPEPIKTEQPHGPGSYAGAVRLLLDYAESINAPQDVAEAILTLLGNETTSKPRILIMQRRLIEVAGEAADVLACTSVPHCLDYIYKDEKGVTDHMEVRISITDFSPSGGSQQRPLVAGR